MQGRSTIDPAELLDFLSETSGAATVLKQRMPGIVAKLKNEPSNIRTFSLDGGIKDVKADAGGRPSAAASNCRCCSRRSPATRRRKRNVGGNEEVSNVSAYWAGRPKIIDVKGDFA